MAKFVTVKLADLSKVGPNQSPQERRVAVLTAQLGSSFDGWKATGGQVIPKSERKDKGNMLVCQATHGKAWRLLLVRKGEITRAVGFGFAKKYLGIDMKIPE